jgi:putative ABC transport system permease protein
MLHEKSSLPEVNAKITRLHREKTLARLRGDPETWKRIQSDPEQLKRYQNYVGPDFMVRPLRGLNLYGYFGFDRSDQGIRYVYTFSAIALFVLLIACINFMNLATARSANRAREVGLRKVVGAPRKSIAGQFYGESILTTFLAALAALTMVVGLMPVFNSLSGKSLTPAALLNVRFLVGLLAVMLLTGVISGSYPALFLSSFHPIRVLKGNVAGGARSALFRKSLVVVQFGLSVLLLIGMGVVARQVDYMRTKKLGYDKDHLVYLPLRGETRQEYAAFKDELLRDPRILNVTASQHPPTSIGSNSWGADWDGRNPEQRVLISQSCVDFDYTETMKIDLVAGRPFSRSFSTDAGRAFLVNEEVPKAMGLDAASAVGKRFNFMGVDGQIIGVMKNYHYQSVRSSIEPLAVIVAPERFGYAIVRLRGREIPAALAAVKSAWKDIYPRYPVEYRFVDEDFEEMYRSDERMGSILRVFAVMAVFIACLGLFGLASFTAEQRTKEIGVRKVLGASAPGLVFLLSREFAQWVLMANLLAWPAAYFIMKKWLQGFAYKAGIAWWLFALAGAGALFLALCTVSFQAVRAALSNPVDALKYE